ncbi:MAG: hypothetical protein RR348_04285 [Clostridia bacterium]
MIIYIFGSDNEYNRKIAIDDFCKKNGLTSQTVVYDSKGKPTLQQAYISVAHTESVLVVALSIQNIGVDIEKSNRKITIADSVEQWTQLEAYSKYIGTGLTRQLLISPNLPMYLITTLEVDDGYTLSVCSNDDERCIIDKRS